MVDLVQLSQSCHTFATNRVLSKSFDSAIIKRMSTQPVVSAHAAAEDLMPLNGIDHVELWVGNAKQAAFYFSQAFGFHEVAYAGLETGMRDRTSHVMRQGRITLVLTGTLGSRSEIAAHHRRHGDGVKVIALSAPDAGHAYATAVERGARRVEQPHDLSDEHRTVTLATIVAYGDRLHTFVERSVYHGAFLPGYVASDDVKRDAGLLTIDHIVGNV